MNLKGHNVKCDFSLGSMKDKQIISEAEVLKTTQACKPVLTEIDDIITTLLRSKGISNVKEFVLTRNSIFARKQASMRTALYLYQNYKNAFSKIFMYFAHTPRHSVTNLSARLKIAVVAAISLMQSISPVIAYDSYELSEIKNPIDALKFATYKYLFNTLSETIHQENVFYFEDPKFFIFRVVDSNFCRDVFCVTFIVKRCDNQNCPSTTILVQDHFYRHVTQSAALGEWLRFPSRVKGNYTFVMVTKDFIASHQGI